jgi:hypothetical protein
MTEAYGMNCSNRNEFGQRLDPKPVWGATDHQGMAVSASRGIDTPGLRQRVREFYAREHGRKPTRLLTKSPARGLRSLAFTLDEVGFVSLEIVPGAECDALR